MPIPSVPAFRGLPVFQPGIDEILAPETSPSRLPVGFGAVSQFDRRLLQVQLLRNLQAAGVAQLATRVAFGTEVFPAEVRAAAAPHVTPLDGRLPTFIELRLRDPHLVSLGSAPEPPIAGGVVISPRFFAEEERPVPPAGGPSDAPGLRGLGAPVVVTWILELNLLRVRFDPVSTSPGAAAPSATGTGTPTGSLGGVLVDAAPSTGAGPSGTESRVLLAAGRAVTRMPAHVASRPELLQAWVELDVARTETTAASEAPALAALLDDARGKDMLRSALAPLMTRAGLRLTPRVSPAGSLAPQQVAALGLPAMTVVHAVRLRPDGSEVLSLCFGFGDDRGSLTQLQPFLGASHFAHFVTLATLAPVVRTRWRLQPAAREFVGDVHVDMPLHEGSEETGEGTLRLHVRLDDDVTDVALMALEGEHGDVLRLACTEEVQLLRAWFADGSEVRDLGELKEPATFPLVVNVAPFTAAPAGERRDTPFRDFLRHVVEPVALPFVERFAVRRVGGFASEALGMIVSRWSLPTLQDQLVPPDEVGGAFGGGR